MRMVKSNSANQFNNQNTNFTGGLLDNSPHYGTLNSRSSNYSMLKSRMKQQQRQRQVYSIQSNLPAGFAGQPPVYFADTPTAGILGDPYQQEDPTTLSLLSLNSALSGSNQAENQLCHYHRTQQHHQDAVILEQDERDLFPAPSSGSNELLLVNNILPPPSSRAIEVLENQTQYQQESANNFYK